MDGPLPRENRLSAYVIFGALAMGLGFGLAELLRLGPVFAGIYGALAIAWARRRRDEQTALLPIILAGAIGIGAAALMDFHTAQSFLATWPPLLRGFALLAIKGAIAGALGGAILGMAVSAARYRKRDILWLVILAPALYVIGAGETFGGKTPFDLTKTLLVGAALALLWLRYWKRDSAALTLAAVSAAGFGLGALAEGALAVYGPACGAFQSWPLTGALVHGACGGAAWGVALFALDEERVRL